MPSIESPLKVGGIAARVALLEAKTESEAYFATMTWLPALRFVVEKEAMLLVLSGTCASSVWSSQNDTMPVGLPEETGLGVTVAANVTMLFESTPESSVVRVALAWTFCMKVALAAGKVASPL